MFSLVKQLEPKQEVIHSKAVEVVYKVPAEPAKKVQDSPSIFQTAGADSRQRYEHNSTLQQLYVHHEVRSEDALLRSG